MSWQDRVKTGYTIRMGDGATFTPKWLNPSFSRELNISMFEYPNVEGTDAKRGKAKGRRLLLELYFDGADHIDTAVAFDSSAKDKRPWTVTHPYYDTLVVQPISLFVDNRDYNVSKISVSVVETIATSQKNKPNAADKIRADKVKIDALQVNAYVYNVEPTTADISEYKGDLSQLYAEGSKTASSTLDSESYFNAFTAANTAIDNLISEPLQAIRTAQAMINAPFLFAQGVQRRIETLVNQFNLLRSTISTLLSSKQKRRYEQITGGIISTIAAASVTNTGVSYKNRNDVLVIIDYIADTYNQYIADLDGLSTATGGDADSYIPDFDSANGLRELVIYTINNLTDVAIEGRQERVIILDRDRAVIPLVYELYGDDEDDSKLTDFIDSNNIGRNELFMLPKGREIKYYVEAA